MRAEKIVTLIFVGAIVLAFVLGGWLFYQVGYARGIAMVDWVDTSSYWTGREHQCVLDGYPEETCYSEMESLRRLESDEATP